jgi:hypothetical protein
MNAAVKLPDPLSFFIHSKHGRIFVKKFTRQKILYGMDFIFNVHSELITSFEEPLSRWGFHKIDTPSHEIRIASTARMNSNRRQSRIFSQCRPLRNRLDVALR